MLKIIFFASFLISLFSCTDVKKGDYLKSISSLEATIDSVNQVLLNNPVDTLLSMSQNVANVEKRIKANYKDGVIDLVFARKMDDYKAMRKSYKPILKAHSQINAGCKEELVALKNLKKDIENGDGERDKYEIFVDFEVQKVNQLRTLLRDFKEQKDKSLEVYNRLHQSMYEFSMELQNKNQAQ